MPCLYTKITLQTPAAVAVSPRQQASVSVRGVPSGEPHTTAVVAVNFVGQEAEVTVRHQPVAIVEIAPTTPAAVRISEICTPSEEEMYVLAASDGILRTCDGEYLLLDPAGEQD